MSDNFLCMDAVIAPVATPFVGTLATAAARQGAANFRANLSVLQKLQPQLVEPLGQISISLEWVFARDGFLSARDESGWIEGCSVPLLAAREMLKKLELIGPVGCFLNPTHAGQIRACFEKISQSQAIIAVIPDLRVLAMVLHCDDFSAQIGAGRLLFVAGSGWAEELADLFVRFPGLPMPQQFLRTALLDDAEMPTYTTAAQRIISQETNRRAERILMLANQERHRTGRVIVLAGSLPKVSDFSNRALVSALVRKDSADAFVYLDPDYPLSASPLALAEAAAQADALVAADVFRSDLPGLVSPAVAWITWITTGRIVPPSPQCAGDSLLLADPQFLKTALETGWRADRVQIAAWPRILPDKAAASGRIALLANTRVIEVPKRVKEFSSQLLLWEMIEEELSGQPLALGNDLGRYLRTRMERFKIAAEGFDPDIFFQQLIFPVYHQGLARMLIRKEFIPSLIGAGWMELSEFQNFAAGPVATTAELLEAVSRCNALIHPYPDKPDSMFDALSLPVIQPSTSLKSAAPRPQIAPLSRGRVLSAIPAMSWPLSDPADPPRSVD